MKIDPELLGKLKKMDENQLAAAIQMIANAAGADEKQKKRALDNISYIKRRIANANEKEANQLAEKLFAGGDFDESKVEEILRRLRG